MVKDRMAGIAYNETILIRYEKSVSRYSLKCAISFLVSRFLWSKIHTLSVYTQITIDVVTLSNENQSVQYANLGEMVMIKSFRNLRKYMYSVSRSSCLFK